ncbi:MAG: hypothetical protein ING65_11880 [Rhodocyclaceae bacterium]|nr:hypothetical protein [Rhodocyclaceae bacterium]
MNSNDNRKKVPRQRRYPCLGSGILIRLEKEEFTLDNFSKFGVAVVVPRQRQKFPSQFACEILLDGKSVHRNYGYFRHRQLSRNDQNFAILGISLADELPVEILLGALSANALVRDVAEQVNLLRELQEPLRATLEHIFLLFSEVSLVMSRLAFAQPELSSREMHHFRLSFLETSTRKISSVLKTIGETLDPIWQDTNSTQKGLFLSAIRKRLSPLFGGILESLGKNQDLPLLYPGAVDLRDTRSRPPFEGEDMMSSLLSTLILQSRSVDFAISLESQISESLVQECLSANEATKNTREAYRILFLCAGSGRIAEGFLLSQIGQLKSHFSLFFADFLEPPLLRSQALVQKTSKSRSFPVDSQFEMHVPSEAARSVFEDMVFGLDLKKWEDQVDAVVCPWLADYLEPASLIALMTKVRSTLKTNGVCFFGKSPQLRPLSDMWPILLDLERQKTDTHSFIASIPSGLKCEGIDSSMPATCRHTLFRIRKE